MKVKLLGVSKFLSKKGDACEVIIVSKQFSDRQKNAGSFGDCVEEIFLPDSLKGVLQPADIGKMFVLEYSVSSGRAYFEGFKEVK